MTTPGRKALATLACLGATVLGACSSREDAPTLVRTRLLPALGARAASSAPPPGFKVESAGPASLRPVASGGDERMALVVDAPATITIPLAAPLGDFLSLGIAVRPDDRQAQARIAARTKDGTLYPLGGGPVGGVRGWRDWRLPLRGAVRRAVAIVITVEGRKANVALASIALLARAPAHVPNVLLYVVDCLRADHVGAYGYRKPTTPHLDALARDGVVAEHAYACGGWTKPSVGCLFTGEQPSGHGARSLADGLSDAPATLAETFRGAGYATAAWVANPILDTGAWGFGRGFDSFTQLAAGNAERNVNAEDGDAALLSARFGAWLAANRERRFFAYLHSIDAHYPHIARPPFAALFGVPPGVQGKEPAYYDAEIAYNDRALGQLLDVLRRLDLYDDTLVVVTADHGEHFGEKGFYSHGHSLFDEILHVPMVLKLPGARSAGRRLTGNLGNERLAATLLDIAGVAVPPSFQGRSFASDLVREPAQDADILVAELASPNDVAFAARDSKGLKLIRRLLPDNDTLLFDTRTDPGEAVNLWPGGETRAAALSAAVRAAADTLEGRHLRFAAGAESLVLKASAPGGFDPTAVLRSVRGDTVTADGKAGSLTITLAAAAAPRHYVLRPKNPAATVSFELRGREKAPWQAALGAGEQALHPPLAVDFVGPAAARAKLTDPALEERLKALGYVR